MMEEFTLRNKVGESKLEYLNRFGKLDWRWNDEGLPWAIQDYHGSKGSVLDFSEDDWAVCKENEFTLIEILSLCDEIYLSCSDLKSYIEAVAADWRIRTGESDTLDEDIPKEDILAYMENFYTWRNEILPKVSTIFDSEIT